MKNTIPITMVSIALGVLVALCALSTRSSARSPQAGPPALFVSVDPLGGGTDCRFGDAGFFPLAGWSVDRTWLTFAGSYYPGYIPESMTGEEKVNPTGNSWEWVVKNDRYFLPLYGSVTLKIVFNKPGGGQEFVTKTSAPTFLIPPYGPTEGNQYVGWWE